MLGGIWCLHAQRALAAASTTSTSPNGQTLQERDDLRKRTRQERLRDMRFGRHSGVKAATASPFLHSSALLAALGGVETHSSTMAAGEV
jgi:hypothetical protein